jgi:flagellar biosynthesis protein FlhF
MPLEILTGPDVPVLLARGAEVHRRGRGGPVGAHPTTAAGWCSRWWRPTRDRRAPGTLDAVARGADALLAARARPRRGARVAAASRMPGASASRLPATGAPTTRRASGAWTGRPPAAPAAPAAIRPRARRFAWPFAPGAAAGGGNRRPHVLVLVGPTGAGKTTTIAKLATHPQAFGDRRVGPAVPGHVPHRRRGAVAPVRRPRQAAVRGAVGRQGHARAPCAGCSDCAIVLVDTPGRGPRARTTCARRRSGCSRWRPTRCISCCRPGCSARWPAACVTAHLPLGVTHLLPTKLDEYPDERGLFELARQFALPMRWIADGQEVPRDLQLAPRPRAAPARWRWSGRACEGPGPRPSCAATGPRVAAAGPRRTVHRRW